MMQIEFWLPKSYCGGFVGSQWNSQPLEIKLLTVLICKKVFIVYDHQNDHNENHLFAFRPRHNRKNDFRITKQYFIGDEFLWPVWIFVTMNFHQAMNFHGPSIFIGHQFSCPWVFMAMSFNGHKFLRPWIFIAMKNRGDEFLWPWIFIGLCNFKIAVRSRWTSCGDTKSRWPKTHRDIKIALSKSSTFKWNLSGVHWHSTLYRMNCGIFLKLVDFWYSWQLNN